MALATPLMAADLYLSAIRGDTSIAIMDPTSGALWQRSGDMPHNAASTIKVLIMLELFRRYDLDEVDLGTVVRVTHEAKVGGSGVLKELMSGITLTLLELTHLMMVVSDNTAANLLLEVVGAEAATRAARMCGAQNTFVRRLFMPSHGALALCNTTTASDMAFVMAAIIKGTNGCGRIENGLPRPESCKQMLQILERQQINDRLPLLLPPGTRVAHKTGELRSARHDVGIIYPTGSAAPYIVSIFASRLEDTVDASYKIAEASMAIYEWFTERQ